MFTVIPAFVLGASGVENSCSSGGGCTERQTWEYGLISAAIALLLAYILYSVGAALLSRGWPHPYSVRYREMVVAGLIEDDDLFEMWPDEENLNDTESVTGERHPEITDPASPEDQPDFVETRPPPPEWDVEYERVTDIERLNKLTKGIVLGIPKYEIVRNRAESKAWDRIAVDVEGAQAAGHEIMLPNE